MHLVDNRDGRSGEGAWIEMGRALRIAVLIKCRSREGAWIEIPALIASACQLRGRSRKGAWIEIYKLLQKQEFFSMSLP